MQVKDVMMQNVISVQPGEPVLKAARLMLQYRISGLPVVDKDGELIGIITAREIFSAAASSARSAG
jgi:CIC family chloride channel protein